MLIVMKNIFKNSLLLFILVGSFSVCAELYRGLDAEGNVVYSDTPFEDAEAFTPPPISVMDKPKAKTEESAGEGEKSEEFKYISFDITSPTNNQTIRNEPELAVNLSLKPGLNTEENHSIWLLLDDKPVIKKSQSLTLQLGRIDRGAHKLQAQVRTNDGKIVLRTRTTVVFIHQTSAQ